MRRVVAACVIAAGAFAACAAPRQTLGTRSSVCFRSLPTARAAVQQQGRLVGVRLASRKHVLHAFPHATLPSGRDFCVVAFSDDFRAEKVQHAASTPPTGKYAVVVVTMRGTTVIQTFLVDRLPLHVSHR
ncbi:MAG: hypothetical protein JOZ68_20610 [Acidimicrobiia bacterium]|nr:hypothetical protein [Acidimicrobiia bacterium]MBV9043402.1 hypothetical protein [Acidimicrobiia bacterium]MBV9283362.1 hypothetical protein [Acidimicrobiia bacterium]